MRGRSGSHLLFGVLLTGTLLATAARAQAPPYLRQWGSEGQGDGQFKNSPSGIAVDGSGNVYVVDDGNYRIQKFSSTGAFLAKWGSFGTGSTQFWRPLNVAVDGSSNVYVSDWGNHRIQVFGFTPVPVTSTSWGRIKVLYR